MKRLWLLAWLVPLFAYGLTVQDVTTTTRFQDGNTVSDADGDGQAETVSGAGGVTVIWDAVTTDQNGNPITIARYELRYKLQADAFYELVIVPANTTQYTLTLVAGSYEVLVQGVTAEGVYSPQNIYTFTVQ